MRWRIYSYNNILILKYTFDHRKLQDKMPVVQIETNLKVADIPTTFVADFNKALAPVMGKDLAVIINLNFVKIELI